MQIGFIGFAALLSTSLILEMSRNKELDYNLIPVLVYAVSIGITGIYSTKSFVKEIRY